MKIIRSLNQANLPNLALTIGNFDGVHLGHQKIISEVKNVACKKNLASAILTFEPHPASFFKNNLAKNFRIHTLAQKLKIFAETNIDYVFLLSFNKKMAESGATNFIEEILFKNLNIKHLLVGYDFVFGKNRSGNFVTLKEASKKLDFKLEQVPAFLKSEEICSSSLIRNLISQGKVLKANELLGRNFSISGTVISGEKLANQIGFPTANLKLNSQIIKPKFGVYKTIIFVKDLRKKFQAISNFGIKPTFNKNNVELLETHIFDFDQNIYGKKIEVEFIDFIREEKKFSSVEELKKQINEDLKIAKKNSFAASHIFKSNTEISITGYHC